MEKYSELKIAVATILLLGIFSYIHLFVQLVDAYSIERNPIMTISVNDKYIYQAKVIRWIDGDTVELSADLGFRIYKVDRFRLLDVDTPERGQDGFTESVQLVNSLAPENSIVIIKSYKMEKYGRWLAEVYTLEQWAQDENQESINDVLKKKGWIYKRD